MSGQGDNDSRDLAVLNHPRRTLPGPELLHELIAGPREEQILLDFLFSDDRRVQIDYLAFQQLTDLLAQQIRDEVSCHRRQVGIIPVIVPQCPELYVAWVAVLKAGAGVCPVGVDVPFERLRFIVKDVAASVVITIPSHEARVRDILPDMACISITLEDLQSRRSAPSNSSRDAGKSRPPAGIDPGGPAYVMYTSGSTGLPKGVKISHRSASQSILAHDEHIPNFKRFLQFASPTFDVSIFEIFFPFFRGATLVGCERERMLSDLPGTIQLLNADAAELTPTVAGTLLRTRAAAPCLRTLLTIGEMLTTQVVTEFGGGPLKESILYAMYGPTEAAIHCTVAPKLSASASVCCIGRPFATVTTYVLKESTPPDRPDIAAVGEAGELAIAGQLADGYLNRPDQTEAAFVHLPGHGPVYRTGDRAVCLPTGDLEILGRISSGQVKIRGQRVELGEVEEVASKVTGVHLAVASVIDDVLVLFCQTDARVGLSDIRSICRSWLPSFMRPGEIILLHDVPRLPSGKIDRKGLERDFRARELIHNGVEDGFSDETEEKLAAILQEELGRNLGRTTSFWSSGLDSLKAIKGVSKLRREFSVIDVSMILESDNISELSQKIQQANQGTKDIRNGGVDYEETREWSRVREAAMNDLKIQHPTARWEKILPCSSMQIAMLAETSAHRSLNFNEIRLKLSSDIRGTQFWSAFRTLASRNEILRSGFLGTSAQDMPFVQVVWENLEADASLDVLRPLRISPLSAQDTSVWVVQIHHALYDGWSWELILDDLNTILGGNAPLERPQFQVFTSMQRHHMSAKSPEQISHWRDLMLDFHPSIFPMLQSSRVASGHKQSLSFHLTTSCRKLKDFSDSLRCSRETILESSWMLLLSAYLDSTDVCSGVVSAGRHLNLAGLEAIIGPCLSTFPLRVEMAALKTAHDLIDYVQRWHLNCLKFGNTTLREIGDAAGLTPVDRLFDTLCVWQQGDITTARSRRFVNTESGRDVLDYAIVLEFEPIEDLIVTKLTFDSARIPETHANLLLAQLDELAGRLIDDPEQDLIDLLTISNMRAMSAANAKSESFDRSFDLMTTIADLAQASPSKTAIECVYDFDVQRDRMLTTSLSYGDLFAKASRAGQSMIGAYAVQPDDLVCVFGEKSVDLYVAILAVVAAGAGYMCVDSRTPTERIDRILQESKCKLIISDRPGQFERLGHKTPNVTTLAELLDTSIDMGSFVPHSARADHLAYAVFTSGSTGIPKGVLLTRKNLLSNIDCLSRIYPCERGRDRLLQACSPAFDVSVFEIFWTWHMGMTLCAAPNDILFRDLEGLIDKMNITHLSMTPSVAAMVAPGRIPKVKLLVTAGEPMSSKVFTNWAGKGLYQGYGPSETTNICNIRPEVSEADISNNVGPALANTSIFVCQRQRALPEGGSNPRGLSLEDFRILPKGAAGEIWIGGCQVGRGYIDPMLTTRSFLDHPQYGRLYRSGDIGRLLADDSLVILGRDDDQVKLRGQRIELGDINSSLVKIDPVKDAVSMIVNDDRGHARLVSFWVPNVSKDTNIDDYATTAEFIFQQLQSQLPEYMIPDTLINVQVLPLTRQGKIDKKWLAQYYANTSSEELQASSRHSRSTADSEPLSGRELTLAQAISHVLNLSLEMVFRHSSFYALGLDSISAIRLSRHIRELGFHQIDVSTILKHPSIDQLLPLLKDSVPRAVLEQTDTFENQFNTEWKADVIGRYARMGLEVESFLPCTPLQESMLSPASDRTSEAYRNHLRFTIHGDWHRLQEAWMVMTARHQLLRTGFVTQKSVDTPFVQVVIRNFCLPWIENGSKCGPESHDLEGSMLPPWTLEAQQDPNGAMELHLDIHHALYDADAMAVLLHEVEQVCLGQELPPAAPFGRYLQYMADMKIEEVDAFWRKQLTGVKACRLTDVLRGASRATTRTPVTVTHEAELRLNELETSSRRWSTTTLGLLQAAWVRLLFCYFRSHDVCVGNVMSGRTLPIDGVERIVAPCFNTVPLRIRLQGNASNHDLCRDLQKANVDTLPFQPSSLRRIQRQHSEDGRPLFDTLILLQQEEFHVDENIWTLRDDTGDMSFPFILEIVPRRRDDSLVLRLHSMTADKSILANILANFDTLVQHTARFPQARAADFSPISEQLPQLRPPPQSETESSRRHGRLPLAVESPTEEWSPTERQIRDVLIDFKPEYKGKIAKTTTIFRLGLDSIGAVQIAAALRKYGYNILSSDILENPTIAQIATLCYHNHVNQHSVEPGFDFEDFDRELRDKVCEVSSINSTDVEMIRPCTPTQAGILSQFIQSKGRLYFNNLSLRLDHEVEPLKLERAWNAVMNHHEMLRTGFVEMDVGRFPFAMVTYRPHTQRLPWIDVKNEENVSSQSILAGAKCLEHLAKPPWCLRLVSGPTDAILKLSILHALYDAQSLDIILQDVAAAYRVSSLAIPAPVSPAVATILQLSQLSESKEFWTLVSQDMCSTRFPDMKVFITPSQGFSEVSWECERSAAEFEQACAGLDTSLHALCATAWSILLAAYTAQSHVTFGLVLSGRSFGDEKMEAVAFPCINTVPFAISVGQDQLDLLHRVTDRCGKLTKHQFTPTASIKRWAGMGDDLFDTVLVLQKYTSEGKEKRPWTVVEDNATAEYAVSLEVLPQEEGHLRLQLTFQDDVMPTGQATIVLQEFEAIMATILGSKTIPPAEVPRRLVSVVPAKEERLATEVRYLHQFVESMAKEKPESIALEFVTSLEGDEAVKQTWTYAELDALGNQISHLLKASDVDVGELVGICFEKCPEASFAILGILKAGCAYVAVDPGAPKARKEFILKDACCKVILTCKGAFLDAENLSGVRVLAIDDGTLWNGLPQSKLSLSRPLEVEDTCYCLYTSGTTGTPKGCLISHDSAVQAMMSFQRIFRGHWSDDSRWLQFASYHFDVSVLEQFWSWSVGIRVTSAPRDLLFEDLPGTISKLKITHLDLTPSLARLLTPADVPTLCQGVFIVGGEQVRQDVLETWGDARCLYNFYGPSEVTIGCTVHPRVAKNAKPTNIGQQWDNVGSFVLETRSQKPVLRGAIGELCLSGPLVGKGYLNRPKLTESKFAILEQTGSRVYRTGDLVRLLHDNSFEFLGRIDDQVKLRGQRLEIGEINHAILSSTPAIKDVATMVLKHSTQEKEQLVAFFSTEERRAKSDDPELLFDGDSAPLVSRIRRTCVEKLPAYMVPTYFLRLTSIPLSVNNKIEHKTLKTLYEEASPEHFQSASALNHDISDQDKEAVSQVADVLAAFWRISSSSIKASSRLFELGLDSVSVIGLSRLFKKRGFSSADVATIMKNSIVADLAHALRRHNRPEERGYEMIASAQKAIRNFAEVHRHTITETLQVDQGTIEYIAPCTPLQEGMISRVLSSDESDPVYFTSFNYELDRSVDMYRLEEAWTKTQTNASILRTHFVPTGDGFAQVVLYETDCGVVTHASKTGKECRSPDEEFGLWLGSVKTLSRELPWQVKLTQDGGKKYMILRIFHGLYDGISLPLLLEEVAKRYQNMGSAGTRITQFYEILPYGPLARQTGAPTFWRSRLKKVRLLGLPSKYADNEPTPSTISIQTSISDANVQGLCSELNVTTPAVFHAAWLYSLHRKFKVNPTIGIVVSGRAIEHEHAEDVLGPMFNTIPCALNNLAQGSTVVDLIRACHHFNVDAVPYQHTALRDVAKWTGQSLRTGLFDSLFVFQREFGSTTQHSLWRQTPSASLPDYALNMEVEQKTNGHFVMTLVAKAAYLDEADARDLLDVAKEVLRRLERDESIELSEEDFCQRSTSDLTNALGHFESSDQKPTPGENAADEGWDENTQIVRDEIAKLAGVKESAVLLNRPTLFELGLDSIDALKLAARLKSVGFKIPVSSIMKSPTAAGIAQAAVDERRALVQQDTHNDSPGVIASKQNEYIDLLRRQGFDVGNVQRVLPVTPMQEGLLAEYEKYYNIMTFQLAPGVEIEKLLRAWKEVLEEDPILRATFVAVDESDRNEAFLQVVERDLNGRKQRPIELQKDEDLSSIINGMRQTARIDGLSGQRVRVVITSSGEGGNILLLGMPHATYDAWSLHLLHQQVAKLYDSEPRNSGEAESAELFQYEQHMEHIFEQANSEKTRKFWSDVLFALRPTLFSQHSEKRTAIWPPLLLQQTSKSPWPVVLEFCKRHGIMVQSLGLACWTIVLAHYTKQSDICFGVVLSGRTTEGSEELVGPTFNTVIFRQILDLCSTKEETVKKIHDQAIQISGHQHYPLREAVKLGRKFHKNGELLNTLFTFQKTPPTASGVPALYHEIEVSESAITPPYPVNIEMEARGDQLWWTVACQEGVIGDDGIKALVSNIDGVLHSLIETPEGPLVEKKARGVSLCGLPETDLSTDTGFLTMELPDNTDHFAADTWTATEEIIRDVLTKVSKADKQQIKKDTGFFHLGLDSISAIKVTSLLRKEGLKIPVSEIIRVQTVRGMAKVAEQSSQGPRSQAEEQRNTAKERASSLYACLDGLDLDRDDVESILPVTGGQMYMLDTWSSSKGRLFYPTFWFEVTGTTKEAFQNAVSKLARDLPILRTVFVTANHNGLPAILQLVLNHHPSKYDVPWSFSVVEAETHLLVALKMHHALYDAVSMRLIVSEIERLCKDVNSATGINSDWSSFVSLTDPFLAEADQRAKEFWTSYLGRNSGKFPRLHRGSFEAKRISHFDPEVLQTSTLEDKLKQLGISFQALFFAAYAQVYAALLAQASHGPQANGTQEAVFGVYLANRSLDVDGLPDLVAPTFNVAPLRIRMGRESIVQTARQVQTDLGQIGQAEHCGVSMRDIHAWTAVKVDCYLNFLKLPGGEDGSSREVKMVHAGGLALPKGSVSSELKTPSPFLSLPDMGINRAEWCLPAVDIEAKIENGYLGVGIFGPEDMLTANQARLMLQELVAMLSGVAQDGQV